jgi:hypothetical protein
MFEQKKQKVAPVHVFIRRLLIYNGIAILLTMFVLIIGVVGYHWIAGYNWVDSFLNASMILGGMGQVNLLTNSGAKVFASLYALFSGIVFIAVMGIVFSPIIHRMFHKSHIDDEDMHASISSNR